MRRLLAVCTVLVVLVGMAASALGEPTVPGCSVETYVTLDAPILLCFDDGGFLYVGDGDNDPAGTPIRKIPPGGGSFEDFGPPLPDPDPVGYDRTGKISAASHYLQVAG